MVQQASDQFSYDVFLSHSSKDKGRVRESAERMRSAGLRVWFDEWLIKPGDDIYLAVEKGLQNSRTQILFLSSGALESEWVDMERSTALFRDPSNSYRRFVPALLSTCEIPDGLKRLKYVDLREGDDASVNSLIKGLRDPENWPPTPPTTEGKREESEYLRGIARASANEWKRCRVDFEAEASKYHDLRLSVFYVCKGVASEDRKFAKPNHCINLWQYFGSIESLKDQLKNVEFTKFGASGCKISALAVVEGEQTPLFCRMASRMGSLLPNEVNHIITSDCTERFKQLLDPGKPAFFSNSNPLAKWLNLTLGCCATSHPDRFKGHTLSVDPFTASLSVFDLFGVGL